MRTTLRRVFVGSAVGLFSGTISAAIVVFTAAPRDALFHPDWCCVGSFFLAFLLGPIGAYIGIVTGTFINTTGYTSNIKYKWGIVTGLGAALGAVFVGDMSVRTLASVTLIGAINGTIVVHTITARFAKNDHEPDGLKPMEGYALGFILIAIAVNRLFEWYS